MHKYNITGVDQDVYFEKLDNGLEVYIIPFKNKKNYFINYFTKFGSLIQDFYSEDKKKFIHIPEGVAHFLEHKMFEEKDGLNPFEFFSQSGASCNASTSYKSTRFYVSGTTAFSENLNYLINYVNSPYFTDDNVEKEKGIIIEEIGMINDNPEWVAQEELLKMTFQKHNMRIPIIGTRDSVNATTKENLYDTYNAFYNPNNMCLIIGGEVDVEEVIGIIKNNETLNSISKKDVPEIKKIKEPIKVKKKKDILKIDNVTTSKVNYMVKLDSKIFNVEDKFELSLYIGMILNILYGSTSLFRERMLEEKSINSLYLERMFIDDILLIEFDAETKKTDYFIDELCKELDNYEITKEDVERYKKVWIASEVMNIDDVTTCVNSLVNDIIDYGDIKYNRIEYIKNMSYDKLLKIKNKLDFSNSSILFIEGKD